MDREFDQQERKGTDSTFAHKLAHADNGLVKSSRKNTVVTGHRPVRTSMTPTDKQVFPPCLFLPSLQSVSHTLTQMVIVCLCYHDGGLNSSDGGGQPHLNFRDLSGRKGGIPFDITRPGVNANTLAGSENSIFLIV